MRGATGTGSRRFFGFFFSRLLRCCPLGIYIPMPPMPPMPPIPPMPPETISYVETRGTGTRLGDPIEVAALTQAFQERTAETGFCAIGAVKTNIGHLDAAARHQPGAARRPALECRVRCDRRRAQNRRHFR